MNFYLFDLLAHSGGGGCRVEKSCDPGNPGSGNALGIWRTFLLKIYAVFSNFEICHDLRTFETIFRLNVGNILDDWDRLRIIDLLFFLLIGLYFPLTFFLAMTGECYCT